MLQVTGWGQYYLMCFHMELSSPLHLFASRTLSCSEVNYSQVEKEALAIIFGVCKFHQYLYGKPFVLVTDHKPLTTLLGSKTSVPTLAASRMQRWALVIIHIFLHYRISPNSTAHQCMQMPCRGFLYHALLQRRRKMWIYD